MHTKLAILTNVQTLTMIIDKRRRFYGPHYIFILLYIFQKEKSNSLKNINSDEFLIYYLFSHLKLSKIIIILPNLVRKLLSTTSPNIFYYTNASHNCRRLALAPLKQTLVQYVNRIINLWTGPIIFIRNPVNNIRVDCHVFNFWYKVTIVSWRILKIRIESPI